MPAGYHGCFHPRTLPHQALKCDKSRARSVSCECYTLQDVESGAYCTCGSTDPSPGLVPHVLLPPAVAGAIGESMVSAIIDIEPRSFI